MTDLTIYAQLGGTVVVVVLFLRYLNKRDVQWNDSLKENNRSNILLAKSLQKLTDVVEESFNSREKNTIAIKQNTDVVDKGTAKVVETLKANGNGY